MSDFFSFSDRVEITHNYHKWLRDVNSIQVCDSYQVKDDPLTFLTYLDKCGYLNITKIHIDSDLYNEGEI